MIAFDIEHVRLKCVEAINALSKTLPEPNKMELFEQTPTFRLFVYLHNQPQPFMFELSVPCPALHNPLIVTQDREPHTVRTVEECKVLVGNFTERRKWISQYSAVVIQSQFRGDIGWIFGANFEERRPFLLFDEFANYTGARINGTIFTIELGSHENALQNIEPVLEKILEVFPNFDNIQQLHIGLKDNLRLPVFLQVPPVGACYEEVFQEKDVLEELLATSLDELQRQGIISESEKTELQGKSSRPLL